MKRPPNLKKGDTIGVFCPARKVDTKDLQPALDILDSWGLKMQLGKSVFLEENQFAGNDTQRAEDLQEMLNNKNIKALIAARGGYGCVRIIDLIDFRKFRKKPKWIIGYSDMTVLHNHINRHCKAATIHATMPINFSKNTTEALQSLKDVLFGKKIEYSFASDFANRKGK